MKKIKHLHKKLRRHPKPEKFWATVLCWFFGFLMLIGIMGYEPDSKASGDEIKTVLGE